MGAYVEQPPVEESPNVKSILTSKTFWVNAIMFVAFVLQRKWGFIIDETLQVQALGLVNIFLRMVTKEPVRWK